MNGLVDMLRNRNMGIELASQVINCLLLADDIILLEKSEADLQARLNIHADVATKSVLKVTTEYKYLGVYFSRSPSLSYDLNSYIKENFEKKVNYIIKLVREHGSFNRISFGDALLKSIILRSIAHGCAIWIPSSKASITSLES